MFHSTVESSKPCQLSQRGRWLLMGLLGFACLAAGESFGQGRGLRGRNAGVEPGDEVSPNEMRRNRSNRALPGGTNRGQPGWAPEAPRRKAARIGSPHGLRNREGAGDESVNQLPKGFSVPPEPPDWLTTTEEWQFDPFKGDTEKDKERDRKIKYQRYKEIALKGELTRDEDKQLMADVIEYKLAEFTRKENHEKAYKLREELFRDIKSSGSGRGGKAEARVFMLQTVVEKAPKLFSYHFAARINGAILLADLSEVNEKDQDGRNPPVRFTKAYLPLKEILGQVDEKNRKQPDAVRVWAVDGLMRIGAIPETKPSIRYEIVESLVEQMGASAGDHEWLQWRLAESLGILGVTYNTLRRPIVPQVLSEVLVDPRRPWLVRAEAAQSLGRLPMDQSIDLGLIAREIAHLTEQMSEAYQKKPDQASWKLLFLKLYLAFRPANDDEAKKDKGLLTQVTNKAAISSQRQAVQAAYDVVLPIVQGVVNGVHGLEQPVTQLKDWLTKNPPRATRIAKDEDPIIKPAQAGAVPPSAPAGGSANAG